MPAVVPVARGSTKLNRGNVGHMTAPTAQVFDWNPAQYLKFGGERMRPAIDLLARIDTDAPKRVVDLGCGAGNISRLLAARWPEAEIIGVDSSLEMLNKARDRAPLKVRFERHDIGQWKPTGATDVIYCNAALHWLDDHAVLFPRLFGELAPGGTLAVQMPRNHRAPSHTCMVEAAMAGPWLDVLTPILRTDPVRDPEFYYDALASLAVSVDLWHSEYVHVLSGDDPVVEWTKGSALKPLIDALDGAHRGEFLEAYRSRIRRAYPRRSDGATLFPFCRLFIVARRA